MCKLLEVSRSLIYYHLNKNPNALSKEDELKEIDDETLALYDEETIKFFKNINEEFRDKMLTQRDTNMADYIDQLLQAEGSNTYFIIVGSGHYISDYSVLDMLEEMGYELEQIK